MSRFSGKCDLYDHIKICGLENTLKSSIYLGWDNEEPLDIKEERDLVPYYPFVISCGAFEHGVGTMHLMSKSWVDYEEEDVLEAYLQQILKIQRRCKRKKVEFNVDEVFEEVCYPFYFHEEIKTLIERVKECGKKATYDGIHLSSKNYYRDQLVEEMIKFGYSEDVAKTWVYEGRWINEK